MQGFVPQERSNAWLAQLLQFQGCEEGAALGPSLPCCASVVQRPVTVGCFWVCACLSLQVCLGLRRACVCMHTCMYPASRTCFLWTYPGLLESSGHLKDQLGHPLPGGPLAELLHQQVPNFEDRRCCSWSEGTPGALPHISAPLPVAPSSGLGGSPVLVAVPSGVAGELVTLQWVCPRKDLWALVGWVPGAWSLLSPSCRVREREKRCPGPGRCAHLPQGPPCTQPAHRSLAKVHVGAKVLSTPSQSCASPSNPGLA